VADAVRWDFTPDAVANRGRTHKTVAAGIHSPTSIASLLSGTALPHHHVAEFGDSLPRSVPNLLRSESVSTTLVNSISDVRFEPSEESLVADMLGVETRRPDALSEIEPPFFLFERGPGGHAPYGDFEGDGWEYFEDRGAAPRSQYASEYRRAVEKDTDWFLSRLEVFEERGLLEDTLVVYTSDHGELLGETGRLGHKPPIHPKHVYVPTTFVHPDLDSGVATDPVLRHLDVAPTAASLLDLDLSTSVPPVGRDLTAESPTGDGVSFHTYRTETPVGTLELPFESVWTSAGGYTFPRSDRVRRLLLGGHHLARIPWREYARANLGPFLRAYAEGARTHGAPELSAAEGEERIEDVKRHESAERRATEAVAEESLRQLGYIE
jgi:arylsulfatase A-like enzyme